MQLPTSIIKHDISELVKDNVDENIFKNYKKNMVVLYDVKDFDENFKKGIICRIPTESKYNLFETVYFSPNSVIFSINDQVYKEFEYDFKLILQARVFKNWEDGLYLKLNYNNIKLKKLLDVIFELFLIDPELLFVEFSTNLHKKTSDDKLKQILLDVVNQSLGLSSSIPLIIKKIKKIYIKIKVKQRIRKGMVTISNEDVTKMLDLLDEYNSTKRSYKPLELFNKRLIEEKIPYDFFNRLIQLQGGLSSGFDKIMFL